MSNDPVPWDSMYGRQAVPTMQCILKVVLIWLSEDLLVLFCHSLLWQSVQWGELEAFQILETQGGQLATKTLPCNQHCVLPPAVTSLSGGDSCLVLS